MQGRLMGYVSVMSYGYCQLCVKADPSSLLGFEQDVDGALKRIEELADIGIGETEEDMFTIDVYPKNASYLGVLIKGIMDIHPEFKPSIEKYEDADDDDDSLEAKYIMLTMPVVDDNRRDVINTALDALDTECKVKFDRMKVKYLTELTKELGGEDPKHLDEAKEQMEALMKEADQLRQQLTDKKKAEVEDAYQHWLANGGQSQADANGEPTERTAEKPMERTTEPSTEKPAEKAPEKPAERKGIIVGQSLKMD